MPISVWINRDKTWCHKIIITAEAKKKIEKHICFDRTFTKNVGKNHKNNSPDDFYIEIKSHKNWRKKTWVLLHQTRGNNSFHSTWTAIIHSHINKHIWLWWLYSTISRPLKYSFNKPINFKMWTALKMWMYVCICGHTILKAAVKAVIWN